jgi:uncharacterized cupin superfamily protein
MDPVNEADVDSTTTERDATAFRRQKLAAAAGGEELGCSLYEVPPGGATWPYHYHTGNEEALFVLDGRGTLRTPDGEFPLESGDYAAFPAAEEGAHRLTVPDDADGPLRYLMMSTMADPDVTVYPDSGKVGVFAGAPPGGDGDRTVHGYYRTADAVDYWTDES